MGGGWGLYDRSYEIVDYATAFQAFPHKAGETPFETTVRRQAVDFAAKLVRTGGRLILKVTRTVMESLHPEALWARCQSPVPIPLRR